MKLNQRQKAKLLEWVAAGYQSDEVNRLAAEFDEPFSVHRSQLFFYREHYGKRITEINSTIHDSALTTGLALREERVKRLVRLAELMEEDLLVNKKLWIIGDIRILGKGDSAQVVEREEFNQAEVTQYRGVLADIAQEMGDRKLVAETSGKVTLVWDIPQPPSD